MPQGERWCGAREGHPGRDWPGAPGLEGTPGARLGCRLFIRLHLENFRNCFPKRNTSGEKTKSQGNLPKMLNSSHFRGEVGSKSRPGMTLEGPLWGDGDHMSSPFLKKPSKPSSLALTVRASESGMSRGAAHPANGEDPAEAAPGNGWPPANAQQVVGGLGRPAQGPP